ncbi:MAG: alanine racemase [Clostridiales bacterium]|nr:alanine racemase [Clostridiales bacterium]
MPDRTYVEVDLDAVENNIDCILKKLGGKSKLLAVIKANGYGHGAVKVAEAIEDKCDFFGIACIREAMELVNAGIKKPILVLGRVFPESYPLVVKYDIRIPIFMYSDAEALSAEAVKQGKTALFHFCVDTGMSRIGFAVSEKDAEICKKITLLDNIKAEGLFSHFATADEKDLSKTIVQKEAFVKFADMLEKRGINIPIKHIDNSAGIMNFDKHFDMVRAGIIIYGLYPSHDVAHSLGDIKPAMQWKARLSYVKELEKGREVSYGGTYVLKEKRTVATVPAGYADGYPRCLSNIGRVIINGRYADIIGRVCMDQFMVDVTDIDGVKAGDIVTLVGTDGGARLTMEEVSEKAHSFNYELPCRISRRVERIYYKDGKQIKG